MNELTFIQLILLGLASLTFEQLCLLGLIAVLACALLGDMAGSYIATRWSDVTDAQAKERVREAGDALNERGSNRVD